MKEMVMGRSVHHSKAKIASSEGRGRVSKKIGHLMESEEMPQKQAVATALSMEREHRLTKSGDYRRVK